MSRQRLLFWAGLLLTLSVGLCNVGFIATDDYTNGIAVMVPAQAQKPYAEIAAATHNPPLTRLLLAALARFAYALGIESPVAQLRFSLALLGLFVFTLNARFMARHFEDERLRTLAIGLAGFYFACPLFSTRPLVETVAMPFLVASSYWACAYLREPTRAALALAVAWLAVGSCFRFQLGVCLPVILALPALAGRPRDYATLGLASILLFVATGLPDLLWLGRFHGSLRSYFLYGLQHGGDDYGRMPFYVFPLLIVGLSLPPTLFGRYRGFAWRETYQPLLPAILYFAIFVLAHSLSPHKEERFFVPVLPLFLVLLAPLLFFQLRSRWRVAWFSAANTLLLVLASFATPQSNIIGLVTWLDGRPEIRSIAGVGNTLVIFPSAYLRRKVDIGADAVTCGEALAVREDLLEAVRPRLAGMRRVGRFEPGLLERILVRTNPGKNLRRGAIEAYVPASCTRS